MSKNRLIDLNKGYRREQSLSSKNTPQIPSIRRRNEDSKPGRAPATARPFASTDYVHIRIVANTTRSREFDVATSGSGEIRCRPKAEALVNGFDFLKQTLDLPADEG
jgi:hypothetical protein